MNKQSVNERMVKAGDWQRQPHLLCQPKRKRYLIPVDRSPQWKSQQSVGQMLILGRKHWSRNRLIQQYNSTSLLLPLHMRIQIAICMRLLLILLSLLIHLCHAIHFSHMLPSISIYYQRDSIVTNFSTFCFIHDDINDYWSNFDCIWNTFVCIYHWSDQVERRGTDS
jgi:hypothetical protein